jgi:hypothetical protein
MLRVTFLMALENQTWETLTVEVPESIGTEREALVKWAETNLARQAQYRKVVYWGFCGIDE